MSDSSVSIDQLKPGDIFLCEFKHPGATAYFEALITALRCRNYHNKEEKLKFLTAAFTILRGLIIYFDQDTYTHASFWDGKGIVEAGTNGVKRNPIEHYKGTNTDVFRFVKDDEFVLGTDDYPVEPLLELSQEILDEDLDYSYTTAILMIFLCITRWERNQWIKSMEAFLKDHVHSINPVIIDIIFEQEHDKLIEFFEWMADEMILQIARFRDDNGLVCSETVAAIFNQSEPKGKYHINKPLNSPASSLKNNRRSLLLKTDKETHETIREFVDELKHVSFPVRTDRSSDWRKHADMIYTPHDLARSENTRIIGRLSL